MLKCLCQPRYEEKKDNESKKRINIMKNRNDKIKQELKNMADKKYQEFSGSLIPGHRPMLGVRIPQLRTLAKELAKGDWQNYLEHASDDTFEEVNLQGFVIGYVKADLDVLLPYIDTYVEKINDWSLNDGFCATLKIVAKHQEKFLEQIRLYARQDAEFKQRFAAVMLMNYYLTDDYIDETLRLLDSMKHPGYYTRMGIAWALATAFAKQRDKTLEYLREGNTLDADTYCKAIQKMLESYRVSEEDKQMLRMMKMGVKRK